MSDCFYCDRCDEKVRVDYIEPQQPVNEEARGHCTLCRSVLWSGPKKLNPGLRRMSRQQRRQSIRIFQLTMFEGVEDE